MKDRTSTSARYVTLMGSGELSPTMVKVHREVLERLGPRPVPSLFLDTPFGFQENAKELSQRAVTYFDESLQTPLEVLGGNLGGGAALDDAHLTAAVHAARYVFSGPGSPTYALRAWQGTVLPQLLAEKLTHGGGVTFASAAALTLGAFTVPVYEIYKVGEDPHWLEGLDVLGAVGLRVAVVPHYNNAEGGTHDTHFCYLGERRLAEMEQQLPEDAFVLGIDEHTALVIDLVGETAVVEGLGVVTVRKSGRSVTFDPGSRLELAVLRGTAFDEAPRPSSTGSVDPVADHALPYAPGSPSPLFDLIREREAAFDAAVALGDATAAATAVLELEHDLHEWSTDVPGQDELVRARASIRAMITRLGELAVGGLRDPREVLGGFVELLIEQRAAARSARRFEDADEVRQRLEDLGVELRDSHEGTEWVFLEARATVVAPAPQE